MSTTTSLTGREFQICDECKHWTARRPANCLCGCHGESRTWEDE